MRCASLKLTLVLLILHNISLRVEAAGGLEKDGVFEGEVKVEGQRELNRLTRSAGKDFEIMKEGLLTGETHMDNMLADEPIEGSGDETEPEINEENEAESENEKEEAQQSTESVHNEDDQAELENENEAKNDAVDEILKPSVETSDNEEEIEEQKTAEEISAEIKPIDNDNEEKSEEDNEDSQEPNIPQPDLEESTSSANSNITSNDTEDSKSIEVNESKEIISTASNISSTNVMHEHHEEKVQETRASEKMITVSDAMDKNQHQINEEVQLGASHSEQASVSRNVVVSLIIAIVVTGTVFAGYKCYVNKRESKERDADDPEAGRELENLNKTDPGKDDKLNFDRYMVNTDGDASAKETLMNHGRNLPDIDDEKRKSTVLHV